MQRLSKNVRRALVVAGIVCAIVAVVDLALHPLYTRGIGQRWISHANGLSTMLSVPGLMLVVLPGLRQGQHTSTWVWLVMQALNFAVYTAAVATLLAVWQAAFGRARRRKGTDDAPGGPTRISRRKLLLGGAGGLTVGAAAVYPMSIATRHFEVTWRTFPLRDLPPALVGLRIVQLSDIHHGPWIPIQHVRTIVRTANDLAPDVILLTGDYVHRSAAYITPVVNELAKLRATIGIVGVLGNHDWWEDGPLMQREFARIGIPLIDNSRRFVTPQRQIVEHGTEGLCLAGVGDLYTDTQRYDAALGDVPPDMPRLLLSHNPDVSEDPALAVQRYRIDLMLSGHTHGGQIYVPGIGSPIVPSQFGQKYARGLVQGPVCPVFISRGLGHTVLPVRIGVRPEMAVMELTRA